MLFQDNILLLKDRNSLHRINPGKSLTSNIKEKMN